MNNYDNFNCVTPVPSPVPPAKKELSYVEQVQRSINNQRESATKMLVQCAEVEPLLQKAKLSINEIGKLNKMLYGY
jgi:hypothetical protein